MAERLTTCPKCNSFAVSVVKIHNPETTDMNAKASLKCRDCDHEWEGKETSPYHKECRRKGWAI